MFIYIYITRVGLLFIITIDPGSNGQGLRQRAAAIRAAVDPVKPKESTSSSSGAAAAAQNAGEGSVCYETSTGRTITNSGRSSGTNS